MRIPDSYLEQLIADDCPALDLTTHILGIGSEQGQIEYFTRDEGILCGTEEAARIYEMLGCQVKDFLPTASSVSAGEAFMHVEGPAEGLHMGWKCCLNIFEYYSALATKAHRMVQEAHRANPHCEVLTTRKLMPGTKPFDVKAILAGGAVPHRLGLSETVLVFEQHLAFFGGIEKLIEELPALKAKTCEKKFFVEASQEHAVELARAGVDGLQLDKVPVEELDVLVSQIREANPNVTIIAAGGVNLTNAYDYAATGVDGLATTCLHFAKPLDMSARMKRSE